MATKVLYNYIPYEVPKLGVFNITTGEYKLPGGWLLRQDQILIIGESDDCFIEKLQPSSHGEWVGDTVIQTEYILPLGIHKSRLVKWI